MALRFLEAKNEPKVLQFVRLGEGGLTVEVFQVERRGVHYVLTMRRGGGISYGIQAQGSRGQTARAFDTEVTKARHGVDGGGSLEVSSTRTDPAAMRSLAVFEHPIFGVKWDDAPEALSEQEDFHPILVKQVREWKGSSHGLGVAKHPYWPTFKGLVQEAVARKYGSRIKLYRGMWGPPARKVLAEGGPIKLRGFSSWAADLDGAREYRKLRTDYWVVISAEFRASDVVLAPVVLPEYGPDPKVLMPFGTDVQHSGDELVVETGGTLSRYRVVQRSRKAL